MNLLGRPLHPSAHHRKVDLLMPSESIARSFNRLFLVLFDGDALNLLLYLSLSKQVSQPAPTHDFIRIACGHCGFSINVPVYCGDRFCPVCSVPRLARIRHRLNWLVGHLEPIAGHSFKHLTLTIPSQPDLAVMLHTLVISFRKLRSRALWRRNVSGGASVVEVTGRPGNWHVHLHVVLYARYIPYFQLLKVWKAVSPGQGVWIQKMPKSAIISYLTKYLAKPSVPDEVSEMIGGTLARYRLFQPFGSWYNLSATYVRPKKACPTCGQTSWMPWDILTRCNCPEVHHTGIPPPEPVQGPYALTASLPLANDSAPTPLRHRIHPHTVS